MEFSLAEGVRVVAISEPNQEEFYLLEEKSNAGHNLIARGIVAHGTPMNVIVGPKKGYSFAYDISTLTYYSKKNEDRKG